MQLEKPSSGFVGEEKAFPLLPLRLQLHHSWQKHAWEPQHQPEPSCWAEPQRAPRHFTCCSLVPTSTTSLLATKADSSEWTRGHNVRFGGNFCSLFLPLTQSTRNCFLFHYVHKHHPQWVRPSHPLICPTMQRDFRCLPRPPATRLGCGKNSPAWEDFFVAHTPKGFEEQIAVIWHSTNVQSSARSKLEDWWARPPFQGKLNKVLQYKRLSERKM